ncbi:hypothetical protein CRP01_12810 [Flavilitoribacter nigricans DSM 23189 = NBRC 102662]|uniref:Peptidase S74 domain-containing protein n=2 Tax=Flavilitoribacter TaxID=2762562 RepID=A0A2D0ND66_FLAN2|nr:hypothetical protein CRP01_12810 [Flavilitoribacter nigricans DSM 23189 = NBRC 102662]
MVIEGNGLFQGTNSTNLDIFSTDDNTNSLMRFGDNSTNKVSFGYNGNNDYFNISTAATLGADDLTLSLTGRIGINSAPSDHRMLINQNSTSGLDGDAQLYLQENNTGDQARLRFTNDGDDGYWEVGAAAISGAYQMDFFYTDGLNDATLLSLDGTAESVGIHQTIPEGYLHLKQQFAGADALAFVNDNNANKWSMRIGDEDILIYFNGDIRGGFDVSTGNYNNFPPAPALATASKMDDAVLGKVMLLEPRVGSAQKSHSAALGFNPQQVGKINADWVVPSEDGTQLGVDYLQMAVLAVKTIQEQQAVIEAQQLQIREIQERRAAQLERLENIARLLDR